LLEVFKSFGVARLGAMAGVTAALVGFFFYVTTELMQPPMSLLFSGLDPRDSAEIVAKLDSLKVPYQLQGDGTTIMVAQDQALKLRMELAGDGLPAGGSVGYEIFDKQDALGVTSFMQSVNLVRALEGELARTIRSLDVIDQARVHLVIPKRELFARENREPTASIVVRPRGGQISRAQVQAIQNLVASAVDGMTPLHVSVIDDKGQLLAGGNQREGEGETGGGQASLDERQTSFETRLREQVEEIVTSVVGYGKARVQVSADLDFNRVTKESVTFDPDSQVVRSTQTRESTERDVATKQSQGVTVANGLPDASTGAPNSGNQSQQSKDSTDETVNYEISTEKKTEILEEGRVNKISVAVVVDGAYTTDANGQRNYQARSADEMTQISTLVKSAIGFDQKRGDQVEVVNMRFAEIEVGPMVEEEQPFLGLDKEDILRIAQMAVLAVISLLLILLVFRPMMNRLLAAPGTQALPGPGGVTALSSQPHHGQVAHAGAHQQLPPGVAAAALPGPTHEGSMIDIARVHGQVKESSVKKVGEIVSSHPDEALAIMRTWLHEST
jgi:flagellar M-ring protein FliF